MSDESAISSYDQLVAYLRDEGLNIQANPEQSSLQLGISEGPLEGGLMFIRWNDEHKVVDFLAALPFEVPEERIAAVATAIALLNHVLVLPGFGLNAAARRCYFRFTMPLRDDSNISAVEVKGLFNLCVRNAAERFIPLRAVAEQGADPTTVLQ